MLASPGKSEEDDAVLQWMISLIQDKNHGYPFHIIAFVVFCLEPFLENARSLTVNKSRESILLTAETVTVREYEMFCQNCGTSISDQSDYSYEKRARIEALDTQLQVIYIEVKSALLAVIQRKLAAICRHRDLEAARAANRKALHYAMEFEDTKFNSTAERSNVPDASFFSSMIEALNKGSIYLLPSLLALYSEGELLLAKGKRLEAVEAFAAVGKGAEHLGRADFYPEVEKLIAASRLMMGDALLACEDGLGAATVSCNGRDILERHLTAIVENEKLGESFTIQNVTNMDDALAWIAKNRPKTKASNWPSSSEWQHLISIAHRKIGNVQLASGHLDSAQEAYQDSYRILTELLRLDPGNTSYQLSFALLQMSIAKCMTVIGLFPEAFKSVKKSRVMLESLLNRSSGAPWLMQCVLRAAKLEECIHEKDASEAKIEILCTEDMSESTDLSTEVGSLITRNDAEYSFTIMASIRDDDLGTPITAPKIQPQHQTRPFQLEKIMEELSSANIDIVQHTLSKNLDGEVQRCRKLLRMGRTQEALDTLRRLLFPNDRLTMSKDAPVDARVEFATALILSQNSEGAKICLATLKDSDDPRVAVLRKLLHDWRASFTFLQRLGIRRPPPLPSPPLQSE